MSHLLFYLRLVPLSPRPFGVEMNGDSPTNDTIIVPVVAVVVVVVAVLLAVSAAAALPYYMPYFL